MTDGPAKQPPARDRPSWRETLTDPAVLAIAAYALVAIAAAIAAYFTVFTVWAGYDDEGTLLVTVQAFARGETLYSDIYTIYGPFYFELFGGLFALFGADVTNNVSRSIVIVLWVGTSLCFGLAAQRITGRLLLGVTCMIAAFATLYVLANEPMHPQVLCVALLGLFVLFAAFGPGRRPLWLGAACGALLAALVLTKINLGVYAVAAVALGAVLAVEPLRRRRWLSWPVIAAVLVLPLIVAGRDLDIATVRDMVAAETLALIAIVVAAWPLGGSRGEDDDGVLGWLFGAVAGFVAASVAIMAAILLTGSPLSDVYEGMVTEAMRVRDVNGGGDFPITIAVVDWGVAAVAGAAIALSLRRWRTDGAPSIWPGLLRAAAGLAVLFTVARITPLSLGPEAGSQLSLPLMLCWIAAVPPASAAEGPYKRLLRTMVPALAALEVLQAYPVAGSQVGIASLTFVPVGALLLGDALTSLREWSAARGPLALERFGVVVTIALAALAANFAIDSIVRSIANNKEIYDERRALPFAGASQLRPLDSDVENYTRLVADL
ncbi:MAG TPA: hypothetical protein VFT19_11820, partial [Solirubrobacterales bacterium]|nr:hypothetical protein [Solirubrobacterales bacterium]